MKHPSDFAICISNYLTKHLAGARNLSPNRTILPATILPYKDDFLCLVSRVSWCVKTAEQHNALLEVLHSASDSCPYKRTAHRQHHSLS